MHDSQEHVFTNEFDELRIVISLHMGDASASMRVTISEPDGTWDEQMAISLVNRDEKGYSFKKDRGASRRNCS